MLEIKSGSVSQWVSEWVSEWQGHLLSCQVTAKNIIFVSVLGLAESFSHVILALLNAYIMSRDKDPQM